jgi:hypothetical protein
MLSHIPRGSVALLVLTKALLGPTAASESDEVAAAMANAR